MKELIKKLNDGSPIDDGELNQLLGHYKDLLKLLEPHGELFHLTTERCWRDLDRLEGFKRARKEK